MRGCGGCVFWIVAFFGLCFVIGAANVKHPEDMNKIMPPELVQNINDLQRVQQQQVQQATYQSPTPTPTSRNR